VLSVPARSSAAVERVCVCGGGAPGCGTGGAARTFSGSFWHATPVAFTGGTPGSGEKGSPECVPLTTCGQPLARPQRESRGQPLARPQREWDARDLAALATLGARQASVVELGARARARTAVHATIFGLS